MPPAPVANQTQVGKLLPDGFCKAAFTVAGAARRSSSVVVKLLKTAVAAASSDRGRVLSMSVPEPWGCGLLSIELEGPPATPAADIPPLCRRVLALPNSMACAFH